MITVKNLTKKYPGGVTALDDVSFEVNKGDICGYVGTNGAGKSTTIKILTGVLEFDKGNVMINDINVKSNAFEVKEIIGYVPENANLFNSLSVREFLEFTGTIRNIEKKKLERRISNFLELFECKDIIDTSIGKISKGNKQKILITSALLHDPEVIFFDEPINGLDANSIFIFHDLVSFLLSRSRTVFYCSHLLDTVEKISSKIILIDNGKIKIDMNTSDLKKTENFSSLENIFRDLRSDQKSKKYPYENLFD
jgi:ABC-2 type transport system ATP-binding protein